MRGALFSCGVLWQSTQWLPMTLQALLLVVLAAISPQAPKTGNATAVVDGIASAVEADTQPPLTGSREGDAVLMVRWAYGEDPRFRACAVGDGGKSLGPMQLQQVPASIACDAKAAPRVWLGRAHASVALCVHNAMDEKLAALASGKCDRGRKLTRTRVQEARTLIDIAHVAIEAEVAE